MTTITVKGAIQALFFNTSLTALTQGIKIKFRNKGLTN